jgi:putative ABC transport system substrate-binding protein
MVADLALKYRLPTVTDFRELPSAGGLLSFGPDLVDSYRRAATHVDKILKGAKPGDLAMEQPTKFDLVVNLRTAAVLGLTIPHSVLTQATEVIHP